MTDESLKMLMDLNEMNKYLRASNEKLKESLQNISKVEEIVGPEKQGLVRKHLAGKALEESAAGMDLGELKRQLMSSKDINRNPNVFSPWSFDAAVELLMPELQRKESLLHEMWGKLMDRDWPKVKLEQELKDLKEKYEQYVNMVEYEFKEGPRG
jgi:16S rRNA G1207 methylase RsmC